MRRLFSFLVLAAAASLFSCREMRPENPPAPPNSLASTPTVEYAPDVRWHLAQLLRWVTAPCGAGISCDTASGVGDRKIIGPADPLYRKHVRLFSRGCGLSVEPAPAVPAGKLVAWDIDGDGSQELVFAGGCSPDPYFVVLSGGPETFAVWRKFSARLLGIEVRAGRLVFSASREGYGVERDSGLVFWDCPPRDPASCVEMVFRWAAEISGDLLEGGIRTCRVVRDAALRTGPTVDDEPEESGMGFDWPGNLYQTLAAGSEGWALAEAADGEGRAWALAAFAAPPETEDVIGSMLRPFLSHPPGPAAPGSRMEWMLGWLPSDALRCEAALNPQK